MNSLQQTAKSVVTVGTSEHHSIRGRGGGQIQAYSSKEAALTASQTFEDTYPNAGLRHPFSREPLEICVGGVPMWVPLYQSVVLSALSPHRTTAIMGSR
jgi:hypothetical protein